MASLCRPALKASSRSIALRSRRITYRDLNRSSNSSPFSSSTRSPHCASRIAVSRLGTLESLFPLHSIVAAARLKSRIAVDSSCWSWLSQGGDPTPLPGIREQHLPLLGLPCRCH